MTKLTPRLPNERIHNGVLQFRLPNGDWIECTPAFLTQELMFERSMYDAAKRRYEAGESNEA